MEFEWFSLFYHKICVRKCNMYSKQFETKLMNTPNFKYFQSKVLYKSYPHYICFSLTLKHECIFRIIGFLYLTYSSFCTETIWSYIAIVVGSFCNLQSKCTYKAKKYESSLEYSKIRKYAVVKCFLFFWLMFLDMCLYQLFIKIKKNKWLKYVENFNLCYKI